MDPNLDPTQPRSASPGDDVTAHGSAARVPAAEPKGQPEAGLTGVRHATEVIEQTELPPVAGTQVAATALHLPTALQRRVSAFDTAVEQVFDRIRGNRVTDRLFYTASELGEFSLIWHLTGAARGVRSERHAREALRLSTVMVGESLLVNGGIKSLFRRTRPEWDQPRAYQIRKPLSSSFPSGHASSAFCAAAILGENSRAWPVYYAVAAVVASSRVYVKIHHPSDVAAGIVTGAVLGRAARRLWPRPTQA
jgi:PAP2 superfamily